MIRFKKIDSEDLEFIHNALSNPKVTRFYGVHFNSMEETLEQMLWYRALIENKTGIWWKVQDIKSGEWVGASGFNDWDHKQKIAEIGCWVLPDFWGRGFGSEIMSRTILFGFSEMKLRAINGFVESDNEGIKKVLKRLNFEHLSSKSETDPKTGLRIISDHYQLEIS